MVPSCTGAAWWRFVEGCAASPHTELSMRVGCAVTIAGNNEHVASSSSGSSGSGGGGGAAARLPSDGALRRFIFGARVNKRALSSAPVGTLPDALLVVCPAAKQQSEYLWRVLTASLEADEVFFLVRVPPRPLFCTRAPLHAREGGAPPTNAGRG
jgi:hypothetical protein